MWITDILLSLTVPALALIAFPVVYHWAERHRVSLDGPSFAATSFALALVWIQLGGMLLGFFRLMTPLFAAIWLLAGIILALPKIKKIRLQSRPSFSLSAPLILGVMIFALYLLMATVPPWYRDDMVYHLALPRLFSVMGGYVRPDNNIFASFPLGWESILTVLHTFGKAPDFFPPFNPRLITVWTAGATALASVALARMLGVRKSIANWAGVLLLLVPTFAEFSTSNYVETYQILIAILALLATLRVLNGEDQFLIPAAVCAGVTASIKYTGLFVCAFLLIILLCNTINRDRRKMLRSMRRSVSFILVAAFTGSPFYIRNLIETGNPFFPMAYSLFGGKGWDKWRSWAYGITLAHYGEGRSLKDWFLLPFRLFTRTSFSTGFEGTIGPVVGLGALFALILVIVSLKKCLAGKSKRLIPATAVFAGLWSLSWSLSVQQARYFLVAVPPLLALLMAGIEIFTASRSFIRKGLITCILIIAILWAQSGFTYIWHRQYTSMWLLGQYDEHSFLNAKFPESYPAYRELESLVPPSGRLWLVWMRGYTYYLRRPYRLDCVFEGYRLEALLDGQKDPDNLRKALRTQGIDFLLINHRFFLKEDSADITTGRTVRLRSRFRDMLENGVIRVKGQWGVVVLYEVT